ncbi:hypothetical protein A9Q87_08090 [Flavobacteriales bacterium 34_180_T64]|nr:hypothetical protein A9Q87_08090 [Flavobacteriales bacterium 34_180_T64]
MKVIQRIIVLTLVLITISAAAQQAINYKALIKDGSGNVVASQSITVQFIIYEGAALTNNVYQETHNPTTDVNGIAIVNIGEGTATDVFTDINWGGDDHFLNVQINTGSGLIDMGTTQFMAVPYALQAANVKGLETLDEGNGIGWRLVGQDPVYYGNIGVNAVDLSYSSAASSTTGATGESSTAIGSFTTASGFASTAMGHGPIASGDQSTAMGSSTTASGDQSIAMGSLTTASATSSTAMGGFTTASGYRSTAMGSSTTASGNSSTAMGGFTTASSLNSTAMGYYNIGGGNQTVLVETDPLFEIGNGTNILKSNAFTVLKNGTITAPSFDMANITDNKALVTKEYADSNYNPIGLETLDEGNGIGWRLAGQNPAYYGNIGDEAVDLSYSSFTSSTRGATGDFSTAMGNFTIASGFASIAMGEASTASGSRSTAMGDTTTASGNSSTAVGTFTTASSRNSTAMGYYNIGGGNPTALVETDPLFEIGNGTSSILANAFTVLKNGTITAPSFDMAEITDNKSLITKEYADSNYNNTGLETLDEGNGIGWRLIGRDALYYGNIGQNAVDLSYNNSASTTRGARGNYSTAIGLSTTASSLYSIAMGVFTIASGESSTAMGYSTTASGARSTAMGSNTKAEAYASTAIGRYNIGSGNATNWIETDKLFEIGNGTFSTPANALTVLKNGKTGIGTSTPDTRLRIDADTNEDAFKVRINGSTKFKVSANGGISNSNVTTPAFALNLQNSTTDLLGRGRAYSWNTYSDRRIKSSIRNINYGLQTIMKLRPTAYNHHNTLIDEKSGTSRLSSESVPDIGLIAQDVYELVPESVSKPANDEDLWSMDYTRLVPVLIKAIQEQQQIIEKQNSEMKSLTSELTENKKENTVQNKNIEQLIKRMQELEAINNQ